MEFIDFHSNEAVSSSRRAALMTGGYQQHTSVDGVITAASHRVCGLNPFLSTVAMLLRANNYETIIFGKWNLGYVVCHNRIYLGFDQFVGYL